MQTARIKHFHGFRIFAIGIALCLAVVLLAPPAFAYTRPTYANRQAEEQSFNNYLGIWGNITDPSASSINGSSANQGNLQHLLAWLTMVNENPKGPCGANQEWCWIQTGLGMGWVDWPGCNPNSPAENYTQKWQVYFEDIGAGGVSNCVDRFYPGISIREDSSITFLLDYDGGTGYTGSPQFQAYVVDSAQNTVYINEGELYYSADHAFAKVEAESGTSTTCPTLTNGSPYQFFGAHYGGGYDYNTQLKLESPGSGAWNTWSGSPQTIDQSPYWQTPIHAADVFKTNGPASGPR